MEGLWSALRRPQLKIESPVTIYSGLPNIIGLIVLLGSKRRVAKVPSQKANLFVKSFLHGSWSPLIVLPGAVG